MKARDIIAGWPKGRSTSTAKLYAVDSAFLRWMLRNNRADEQPRLNEFDATVEYHKGQQRMVTAYFEQWRKPEPTPPPVKIAS